MRMATHRWRWAWRPGGRILAVVVTVASVACGPVAAPPTPTTSNPLVLPKAAPGQLAGVLPNSDLAVGPNQRFLLALIDERNRPVTDAQVQLQFFKVVDQTRAQARTELVPAPFRGSPQLGDRGLYVARAAFDEPGPWGAEVRVTRPDGRQHTLRLSFEVRPQGVTPALGSPAPASNTPTGANAAEAERLCSARPVDEFHRLSIAEAIQQAKPLLVLFATPGFCSSATCGPSLEVVQAVAAQHGDRLNVVHVEIYKAGQPPDLVPAVAEWKLPSEPWVFLVNADGQVADKFEGGVTTEELAPTVARLVGA